MGCLAIQPSGASGEDSPTAAVSRAGLRWGVALVVAACLAGPGVARAQGTAQASPQPPAAQVPAAGTPAPGGVPGGAGATLSTQAAVGQTIASDSVPALPAPGAAKPNAASGAASAANVEAIAETPSGPVEPGTYPLDRVVAIVGDEPILWSTVLERLNVERAQGLQVPTDSAGQMALARNVANELINEELLVQKANEMKVEVTDDDVAAGVDDQMKRVRANFSSDVEFRDELKKAGFGTIEDYRKTLLEQSKRGELQRKVIQKLKEDGKLIPVGVTEADINTAFNSSKAKLPRRPATVTFRQIVISPKPTAAAKAVAKAKADSILAELKRIGPSAEQFAQVARRETMDQGTKEQGGDLGWNRRGNMVPLFDRWMFALSPGQLSPVIETVFGYHIIRVDRVKPSEVKASHILIRWKIDTADVTRAHTLADSVLGAWKRGANFDTLVVRFHDQNEEKGSLNPFPRDSLPPSYGTAFAGKKGGDFVGPFTITDRGSGHPKFVIAQILTSDEGGEYTVSDWRDRIRDQLADERAIGHLLESLRKETYVQVRM